MTTIPSDYFDELEERAINVVETTNIGDVCSLFGRKLRMLPPQLCKEVSSWLYALIRIYSLKYDDPTINFPYSPKSTKTGEDEFFISWNIAKFPSRILQGIVVGYMSECLAAL